MITRRRSNDDGLIHTYISGEYTYEVARKSLKALLELVIDEQNFAEIVQLDEGINWRLNLEEEEKFIREVDNAFANYASVAIAIVAKDDLSFGLSRKFEMSLFNRHISVNVFHSYMPAWKWIETMASTTKHANDGRGNQGNHIVNIHK